MFRIGEFARFTRVSVKMLRHYDDVGLLRPSHVDSSTGYRYYLAEQLPRLNRILALRELGFGLAQIAWLLDAGEREAAYRRRERELTEFLAHGEEQLRALRARQLTLDSAGTADPTDVVVRPVEAQLVATLPVTGGVGEAFYRLERYVRDLRARAPRPPFMLVPPDSEPIVAVPLTWVIPVRDGVRVDRLPALRAVACIVHCGDYGGIPVHLQRMLDWLEATGRVVTGPLREVYLRFAAEPELGIPPAYLTDRPDELVTEVQVPVSERT